MSKEKQRIDELVDEFVRKLNLGGLEPTARDEIPELLCKGESDQEFFNWEICRVEAAQWVEPFRQGLPLNYPKPFLSFIQRYAFADFEVGEVMFLSNTGTDRHWELRKSVVQDEGMFPILFRGGYLQFGQRAGGSYGPVCFDTKRKTGRGDNPIVIIDHEDVLMRSKARVTDEVAASFEEFMLRFISSS